MGGRGRRGRSPEGVTAEKREENERFGAPEGRSPYGSGLFRWWPGLLRMAKRATKCRETTSIDRIKMKDDIARDSDNSTYISLLTPVGEGGISVIKLFGPIARDIMSKAFRPKNSARFAENPPGKLFYGRIERDGVFIDEAIVECCNAEGSEYEINCHGGVVAAESVLRFLAELGARRISWKDFTTKTKGKLQTEIREALTGAATEKSALAFVHLAGGALKDAVLHIKKTTLASLHSASAADECLSLVSGLLSTCQAGKRLIRKRRIVIAGRANVGKSSILNAVAGIDRSIVDETPGTTRDLVTARLALGGMPFEAVDTAGISPAAGGIEAEGVERALTEIKKADGVIYVLDAAAGISDEEKEMLRNLDGKRALCAINKIDLPKNTSAHEVKEIFPGEVIEVSAKENTNIKNLSRLIFRKFLTEDSEILGKVFIFTDRQKNILEELLNAIRKGGPSLSADCIEKNINEFIYGT